MEAGLFPIVGKNADAKILQSFARPGRVPSTVLRAGSDPSLHGHIRFHLLFQLPTFVPVDVGEGFVLLSDYTGKEVV